MAETAKLVEVDALAFAGAVSGQKCKKMAADSWKQALCLRVLRAFAGGPPTRVQKSVLLHCAEMVSCDRESMFVVRRRAKVFDFTFILVEFWSRMVSRESKRFRFRSGQVMLSNSKELL